MPRSSFGNTALGGATGGLGRLAQSLLTGGAAEQQGYDAELKQQSSIAHALAQIGQSNAAARKYNADADQQTAETALLKGRPDQYLGLVAGASGSSLPMVQAVQDSIRTGQPAAFDDVGPTPDGSALRSPVAPAVESRIRQELQRLAPVGLNAKDFAINDWANAQGQYRSQDLGDDVLAGRRTARDVGQSQAAVAGKALYNAEGNGGVLDLFGGNLATDNPLAQSTLKLQSARAGQASAAADNSRASAAKTRAEQADGTNRRGSKAPAGYRWTADGTSLETIPGGPADPSTKGAKQAKPPTEGQAKALLFGARMQVADDLFNELASDPKGANQPGALKRFGEGVAGAVPIIGDSLAAGTGALLNGTQSEAQQQVEQAQRDFINAVLRRESGAAIANSEFANARQQYFPQPGDDPKTLRNKAINRRTAIQGFKAEVGDALGADFNRIVNEARQLRRESESPQASPRSATGVSGGWGDGGTAPAASGWGIQRIN